MDETRLAPWALLAAIVSLCASFFVGWVIPVAVVAVVAAIIRCDVRRRAEPSTWALVLGLAAMTYSLGLAGVGRSAVREVRVADARRRPDIEVIRGADAARS